ncbi:MAG: response regulator transcription factor [Tissierellales bacterium]|nr:response regulator transcription factor [Tissierellales bacterium]
MGEKILLLDPDKNFTKTLKYSFEQDSFQIDVLPDCENIIDLIEKKHYDILVTELQLLKSSGLSICQSVRSFSNIPIIFISMVNDDIKKILAFEYGADDYLVKPFNILELKARIKAILRRTSNLNYDRNNETIEISDIKIYTIGRKITKAGQEITLTGKEFDLMYVLASNPGKIFTREELLEKVWGYAYYGDLRTVDVHIRRIREKIEENPKDSQYILTKWGVGYYFKEKGVSSISP